MSLLLSSRALHITDR